MRRAFAIGLLLAPLCAGALAQGVDFNPAMNNPDKAAWDLFVQVIKPSTVPDKIEFETWASNDDTFFRGPNPAFPGASSPPSCTLLVASRSLRVAQAPAQVASPKVLKAPALRDALPRAPAAVRSRALNVTEEIMEETRRNKATFEFIICNKLHTRAGLQLAFASRRPITFPMDSVEIKASYVAAGNRSASDYYIATDSSGARWALIAMHVISKQIPNWTWATFEHRDNAGRCDYIGCRDAFGAQVANVGANATPGGRYEPCQKSDALRQTFAAAGLPPVWENYCLKGTQTEFTTASGVPTLLGNTAMESGFDDTSSCMSCHARAAVDASGQTMFGGAGFISPPDPAQCPGGPFRACSPRGTPSPALFWNGPVGPNQTMRALQTDFVWSIPRLAQ